MRKNNCKGSPSSSDLKNGSVIGKRHGIRKRVAVGFQPLGALASRIANMAEYQTVDLTGLQDRQGCFGLEMRKFANDQIKPLGLCNCGKIVKIMRKIPRDQHAPPLCRQRICIGARRHVIGSQGTHLHPFVGIRFAIIVFPDPGGPIISKL